MEIRDSTHENIYLKLIWLAVLCSSDTPVPRPARIRDMGQHKENLP